MNFIELLTDFIQRCFFISSTSCFLSAIRIYNVLIEACLCEVNESLGRGSSRHLAHVGGGHRRVQVFRSTADENGEEVSAEPLVGGARAADGVSQPRLHLQEVWQKFVDSVSVEDGLEGLRVAAQGYEWICGVATEGSRPEQKSGSDLLVVLRQLGQENEVLGRGHRVADKVQLLVTGLLEDVVDRSWVVIAGRFIEAGTI